MTLRRYAPLKPSRGTQIPAEVRREVLARDRGCVIAKFWLHECVGRIELDHVRNTGMGKKGPSTPANLISTCSAAHRWKTEHGREARPLLLEYLAAWSGEGTRSDAMARPAPVG